MVESEGKGQSIEIQATKVQIVGLVDDPESYPIAKKRHTFEYLRTVSHLRPRTNTFGAITRVRTTLANAIHNYFFERDFQWINTPIITASDCEGAGELFRVSTLDLANLPPRIRLEYGIADEALERDLRSQTVFELASDSHPPFELDALSFRRNRGQP